MRTPSPCNLPCLVLCLMISLASWLYPQVQTQVGYTILTADAGSILPVGAALFSYSNADGHLVSQAGVGATIPILSGRIFVDESGTQTGVALANTSSQDAAVTFILRDSAGSESSRKSIDIPAGRHIATFVFQEFPGLPSSFTGSLTFESSQKLAAITLRQSQNRRGEPLYTTLPVMDLAAEPSSKPLVFPQIAAGDGYTTQLILVNTESQSLTGRVGFTANDGTPLVVSLNGELKSEFPYRIGPQGTYKAEVERPAGLGVGYAVVSPDAGTTSPSGSAVFLFKSDGFPVTEAGVGASPATTTARIFVDNVGSYTGVALASTADQPAEVVFTLLDTAGFTLHSVTRTLPPAGHIAIFAHELFPGLADTFTGLMEIRSQIPLNPITLKLTVNQKDEQILTTLPVADLTRPPSGTSMVFPQIAIGANFSTRLIFINASSSAAISGKLAFFQSDSSLMTIPLSGRTASEFSYQFIAGGGRQYLAGSAATVARILLVNSAANTTTTEIVVNEGNSVHAPVLILDSTGAARDDFDLSFSSINSDIASVDSFGVVRGKTAGFSTFTASAGGVVTAGTITVVKVDSGVSGFEIRGIAQDQAQRLYLANPKNNVILLEQDLKQTPEVYAGVRGTAGLKNDKRLRSLFQNPGFLAFDQARGTMYVSDTANHVIRKVQPGPDGEVGTLAGTGEQGSADGGPSSAKFNNPQGVALDNSGRLWVVDSGNHTIRRISLLNGIVTTIAGKAGTAGWADGNGTMARFNSPVGIALETESFARQLERESKGLPPPPVSVIIADAGNGMIRRVSETGDVETVSRGAQPTAGLHSASLPGRRLSTPMTFSSPSGVAVDPFGSIYVSEPGASAVRAVLTNDSVVAAAQAGTVASPTGLAVTRGGKLLVAGGANAAQEIIYGEPRINKITPAIIGFKGEATVTVEGENFSPESIVIFAGKILNSVTVRDTRTIEVPVPTGFPSGINTLTVQNRAGLAQKQLPVEPIPLSMIPAGHITTYAGGSISTGDGGNALSAILQGPASVAVDFLGNLFIAEGEAHRIRKVNARTGIITSVAGTGELGFSGDDGPALAAQLSSPSGICFDPAGDLLIADFGNSRVRKLYVATGKIATVAGSGQRGYSGDGGPAKAAALNGVIGVAVDTAGNILIAETENRRIRRVEISTGIITTIAGTGQSGYSGDGGPASLAQLAYPNRLAVDRSGNLFFSDSGNGRIRKIAAGTGVITTVAGNGIGLYNGDNIPAVAAGLRNPEGIALDPAGNLFIADFNNCRIRKVAAGTGIITTLAGIGDAWICCDNGPATSAGLGWPRDVAVDSGGNLFIAVKGPWQYDGRIREVMQKTGIILTAAGGRPGGVFSGDGDRAIAAEFNTPRGIVVDKTGNLYICDVNNHRIRKVAASTGLITTIAGTGEWGFSGDNGPAVAARLYAPAALALDITGNLLIVDSLNYRIRRIDRASGIIRTIAGNGSSHVSGDGGPAIAAGTWPRYIAVDSKGNLFITELPEDRVRKIDAGTGNITTIAGTGGMGYSGDNGPATEALLNSPESIAVDSRDDVYIVDYFNYRIRKVTTSTGIITTVVGTGEQKLSSDGGPATGTALFAPLFIAFDDSDNLYISDYARVRKVSAVTRIVTTVAGSGNWQISGDGGIATAAGLAPNDLAFDSAGNLFITSDGCRIRAVRGPLR